MAPASTTQIAPPRALEELVGRFDAEVIDVPGGRARVRLAIRDSVEWDALVSDAGVRLAPAGSEEPDALLVADADTWELIAEDVRGGMDAFRRGRLRVRRNLHVGIGFLAATSGITGAGSLRFDSVRTRKAKLSVLS